MIYEVNIDGRRYQGWYYSPADAVYGAMLKDLYEGNPGIATAPAGHLIGVQQKPGAKGRHKARRVDV